MNTLPPTGNGELTVAQAAQIVGVTPESIRRYLRSGELKGYQLARKLGWRTTKANVAAFLEARKRAHQPTCEGESE